MFARHELHAYGSPLVLSEITTATLLHQVYIKRDDLLATNLGPLGTQVRKVEFALVEMSSQGATDLVVIGRYGCPYMLALVRAAARYATCHCVFFDEFSHEHTGFLSQLHMCNATTYGTRTVEETNGLIASLQNTAFKKVYVSRYGGSESVAAMGGFALYDEICLDMRNQGIEHATIFVGSSSGTLAAGMYAAQSVARAKKHSPIPDIRAVPIYGSVNDQHEAIARSYHKLRAMAIMQGFDETAGMHIDPSLNVNVPEFVHERGIISLVIQEAVRWFYSDNGVLLDPLYGVIPLLTAVAQRDETNSPIILVNQHAPSLPYLTYFNPPNESQS